MITKDDDAKDKWLFRNGSDEGKTVIKSKSDVKGYVEAYNTFLEKCKPVPVVQGALDNIIWEKLEVYFEGGRSAQEAANIIDNRVQLYMDE